MTNRDPNNPEFVRKIIEFSDCLRNYYRISDADKLESDKSRSDIDLVCFYELKQLREHVRKNKGLNHNDFVKYPNLIEEKKFLNGLGLDI